MHRGMLYSSTNESNVVTVNDKECQLQHHIYLFAITPVPLYSSDLHYF
jgi:hypothetical protein